MPIKTILCAGAVGLVCTATTAAPIEIGRWYTFGFGERFSPLLPGKPGFTTIEGTVAAPDTPWTFLLDAPGLLYVADAYQSGDRFQIFDFGRSIGRTSSPRLGIDCATDLYCALAYTEFSRGVFDLEPGAYSITGIAYSSPFDEGAGAFRVTSSPVPVPLPAAASLLGAALATFLLLSRVGRRR